jgi:hypothetical protein
VEDYQQRVIEEKENLDFKILKIVTFLLSQESKAIDMKERNRMRDQFFLMFQYSETLGDRIANFKY